MEDITAYAAYAREDFLRERSSSGGIFSLLAEYVLEKSGVVYGTAMSEDCMRAEVIRVSEKASLDKIRGSKYIQAEIGDSFRKIQVDLKAGKFVLFSGTGCQVNGLRMFLGKPYDNLCCVDVICHGVPSPELWKRYVQHIEDKSGSNLKHVNFRNKVNGWAEFGLALVTPGEKRVIHPAGRDPYMQMFLQNYSLRPSCYHCKAKRQKTADVTLGDFWGIESVLPKMNDNKGISAVILRTPLGKELFSACVDRMEYRQVTYQDVIKENSPEHTSVQMHPLRESFFSDMQYMTFLELSDKYFPRTWKGKLKDALLDTSMGMFLRGGVTNSILLVLKRKQ